jgi:hypothetical protein
VAAERWPTPRAWLATASRDGKMVALTDRGRALPAAVSSDEGVSV